MDESYTRPDDDGSASEASAPRSAESPSERVFARDLLAQLLPGYDPDQLIRALSSEQRQAKTDAPAPASRYNGSDEVAARELARARAQIALGESARTLQHAFNNPLTALLAEAQLLELDPMGDDQRAAVRRILELARRLVGLSRRLNATDGPKPSI